MMAAKEIVKMLSSTYAFCVILASVTVVCEARAAEEPIIPESPKDLCARSPCGPNSECRQVEDFAACSCKENYIGWAPQCRPECTQDSDCPHNRACTEQKCQDPCVTACGKNAQCLVTNHSRLCSCLPGFKGDPLAQCVKEQQSEEKCRNILKTPAHNYTHVFPLNERDNDSIKLTFQVKGDRDANIIFLQDVFPQRVPAYEIVLGSQGNTVSVIRSTADLLDTVTTKVGAALLSPNEWREFWVEITSNTVEVGRKGKKKALMVLEDSEDLPIKYYSVGGWSNSTLFWSLPTIGENDFS